MSTYLGKILFKNNYVNFKPLYEYNNGEFTLLDLSKRQSLLPDSQSGMIFLYSTTREYDPTIEFNDGEFILFDFEFDELEDHINRYTGERQYIGYKINVSMLPAGKFCRLHEIDYYYIVKSEYIEGDYKTNPALLISDPNVCAGMKVVLQVADKENTLIGPLEVFRREYYDNQLIVREIFSKDEYLINAYYYEKGVYSQAKTFDAHTPNVQYILINDSVCKKVVLDIIPLELIVKDFQNSVEKEPFGGDKFNFEDVESMIERYRSSLISGNSLPLEVKEKRIETLTNLLSNEEQIGNTFEFIGQVIGSLLVKYQNNEGYYDLIKNIAESDNFKDNLPQIKYIESQISEKEAERDLLNKEIEKLKNDKAVHQAEDSAIFYIKEKNDEIIQLNKKLEDTKSEIAALFATLKDVKTTADLQVKTEKLKEEIGHLSWHKDQLSSNIHTIEKQIDHIFENSTEKAMNFSFDGMLANKIIQTAAKWETQQASKNYDTVVEDVQQLPLSNKRDKELLEYLIEKIQKWRPGYDRNTIVNILICISQGFLTVFSGEPGTGKTSICKIIADIIGLNIPGDVSNGVYGIDKNRFITVPVERGWTSKRDFIGYYNPLTKIFDQSNKKVFDCLNILDVEANKGYCSVPYFILLDEANLSPMEYYWADYMHVCDNINQGSTINLGENYCFKIPSHLRFLATINNDHTTESLSPRLIDRAWIIRLPRVKLGTVFVTDKMEEDASELVSWDAFKSLFDLSALSTELITGTEGKIYNTLIAKLRDCKITISPRVDIAIRRYWLVAHKLFESDVTYGTPAEVVALDYAIAQKILPHINGSGEKYGENLKQILKMFNENNLRYSAEILSEIIQKGDEMMSYYQFFS